jgi:hypothetical protein
MNTPYLVRVVNGTWFRIINPEYNIMKLTKISPSPVASKKYRAVFDDGTHTDFGASGFTDFTLSRDERRKALYLARHEKNENWNDPKSAGALARWILWNKPTLTESIADYRKRFHL